MTDEDTDVFEITDFTTASAWERFIARLEEVIHDWKLNSKPNKSPLKKNELSTGKWSEQSDTVQFADFLFRITHHCLVEHGDQTAMHSVIQTPSDDTESLISDDISVSGSTDTSHSGAERQDATASVAAPQKPTHRSRLKQPDETQKLKKIEVPQVWIDMMASENDFPPRSHCLSRWYGLREFVVLTPASQTDYIGSESRLNVVLSSLSIALHNTTCAVPVFVQADKKWRRLFFGQCELSGFRTSFEMVHLKKVPAQYKNLSGLVDMFRSKISCPLTRCPTIAASIRFTYVLQEWSHYVWPQMPPDIESATGAEVGCTEFGVLPFGACEDPVSELHLSVTWPSLSQELVVDSNVYSDLDPVYAPHWCARIRVQDKAQCLLSDYLTEFLSICRRKESADQLLGKLAQEEDEASIEAALALHKLTDTPATSLSSIGTVVTKATSKLQIQAEEMPISSQLLNEILTFIFPDVKKDAGNIDVGNKKEAKSSDEDSSKLAELKERFSQLKSAPLDSVVSRLAVCLCVINHSYGGIRAATHLWREFVLEMRFRWENNYCIPDLEPGPPNMGSSILNQKLQMLNCCIEHKRVRESIVNAGGPTLRTRSSSDSSGSNDIMPGSSDDEFFECEEDSEMKGKSDDGWEVEDIEDDAVLPADSMEEVDNDDYSKDKDTEKDQSPKKKRLTKDTSTYTDTQTHQPDGRLRACPDGMKLLYTDEQMYIPVTQEPAPMTEDMLEEHAEVLTRLGATSEGAHLRARMQSACLMSDMESFKAANPGCAVEDFVRWYSPRDWIEEEVENQDGTFTKKGCLSQRMQIPGNMWIEAWQNTKPVPVRRQKRLFDDTKEAEKVLHYLSSLKPSEVAYKLFPMLIHSAAETLTKQPEASFPLVQRALSQLIQRTVKVLRQHQPEAKQYEEVIKQFVHVELLITQIQSLKTKFNNATSVPVNVPEGQVEERCSSAPNASIPLCDKNILGEELDKFIGDLVELPEVPVIGARNGTIGNIIYALFTAAQRTSMDVELESADNSDAASNSSSQRSDSTSSFLSSSVPATEFPAPTAKEYILRTNLPRPAPWSRLCPQRMYCVIVKDDYRFAGAFSSDTTFQ